MTFFNGLFFVIIVIANDFNSLLILSFLSGFFSSSGKEHHLRRKDVFIYVYKVQVNMVPYYASHF